MGQGRPVSRGKQGFSRSQREEGGADPVGAPKARSTCDRVRTYRHPPQRPRLDLDPLPLRLSSRWGGEGARKVVTYALLDEPPPVKSPEPTDRQGAACLAAG